MMYGQTCDDSEQDVPLRLAHMSHTHRYICLYPPSLSYTHKFLSRDLSQLSFFLARRLENG
jgi:hypothetical protein